MGVVCDTDMPPLLHSLHQRAGRRVGKQTDEKRQTEIRAHMTGTESETETVTMITGEIEAGTRGPGTWS